MICEIKTGFYNLELYVIDNTSYRIRLLFLFLYFYDILFKN